MYKRKTATRRWLDKRDECAARRDASKAHTFSKNRYETLPFKLPFMVPNSFELLQRAQRMEDVLNMRGQQRVTITPLRSEVGTLDLAMLSSKPSSPSSLSSSASPRLPLPSLSRSSKLPVASTSSLNLLPKPRSQPAESEVEELESPFSFDATQSEMFLPVRNLSKIDSDS